MAVKGTTTPLSVSHPELCKQWHPERNGGITPSQIVAGSKGKFGWECPEGPDHEWEARTYTRTRMGAGYPCCRNLKVSVTNSLASLFPETAAQLHPDKNNGMTADQIVAGSHKKY